MNYGDSDINFERFRIWYGLPANWEEMPLDYEVELDADQVGTTIDIPETAIELKRVNVDRATFESFAHGCQLPLTAFLRNYLVQKHPSAAPWDALRREIAVLGNTKLKELFAEECVCEPTDEEPESDDLEGEEEESGEDEKPLLEDDLARYKTLARARGLSVINLDWVREYVEHFCPDAPTPGVDEDVLKEDAADEATGDDVKTTSAVAVQLNEEWLTFNAVTAQDSPQTPLERAGVVVNGAEIDKILQTGQEEVRNFGKTRTPTRARFVPPTCASTA